VKSEELKVKSEELKVKSDRYKWLLQMFDFQDVDNFYFKSLLVFNFFSF